MLLATFDPFASEFDRFARRAFGADASASRVARMDAIRHDDEVELRFDLPGFDRDSIDVTVDRGVLTVSAHRSAEKAEEAKPFIRERQTGTVTRRIRLSDAADAEKIEAGYADGVLTVRVPVSERARPRKVEVTDATAIAA